MKVLQQSHLFFQSGDSDKVYVVDLCQLASDQFVVNFRFGKRGSKLREGTKTTLPVSHEKAIRIFEQLVSSKRKKGYLLQESSFQKFPKKNGSDTSAQKLAILKRLKERPDTFSSEWPISRVIWRVGELRIKEAEPLLLTWNLQSDKMTSYSLVWALGRIGTEDSLPLLNRLFHQYNEDENFRRFILAAIFQILTQEKRSPINEDLRKSLQPDLKHALANKEWEELNETLLEDNPSLMSVHNSLPDLYLLSTDIPELQPIIKDILHTWILKAGYFKHIRSVFKLAELRDDGQIWGLIANRIESSAAGFNARSWSVYMDNEWVRINQEVSKPNSRLAFSKQTRAYLRRRISRRLHRLGEAGDEAYVKMASGILLGFREERDGKAPRIFSKYNWEREPGTNRWRTIREDIHYEENWHHLSLYHILFGRSKRYELDPSLDKWMCAGSYKSGDPEPVDREESFPELWDQVPERLIQLLFEADSDQIRRFAKKAILANPHRDSFIDLDVVIRLLAHSSQIVSGLGLELAQKWYDPHQPDVRLILAAILSPFQEAREQGMLWAEAHGSQLIHNAGFVSQVIAHNYADVHQWAKTWMRSFVFEQEEVGWIMREVIRELLSGGISDASLLLIEELLWLCFGSHMAVLDLQQILSLIQSDSDSLQKMGANLLLKSQIQPSSIPNALLNGLLSAKSVDIQAIALQILGKCSDVELWKRKHLLLNFCTTGKSRHLEAVQPLIRRLIYSYPDFARQLVDEWVPLLLREESVEGAHTSFFVLLSQELLPFMGDLPIGLVLTLLRSSESLAQRLGGLILQQSKDSRDLSMQEWIELGNHELLAVRNFIWESFRSHPERIRFEMEEAIQLMESSWKDTQAFAFDYFDKQIPRNLWSREILVFLCDSVDELVREFGRKMIQQCFQEKDGLFYLEHLSQHPSPDMQRYATHFLTQFASGKLEMLKELLPYFQTVLSQPNINRVGRERIIACIKQEAIRSPEHANLFIPLLTRISATAAIAEKATYLEILVSLQASFPHLDFPIRTQLPNQLPHAFFL